MAITLPQLLLTTIELTFRNKVILQFNNKPTKAAKVAKVAHRMLVDYLIAQLIS